MRENTDQKKLRIRTLFMRCTGQRKPIFWHILRSEEEEKKMNEQFINFILSTVNKKEKRESSHADFFIKIQN